ncbi:MAG TPA: type II and III secretion system protein [Terriglobales bacterium]|nr:type II and III secretion system protein [Terriglobales bacterium]
MRKRLLALLFVAATAWAQSSTPVTALPPPASAHDRKLAAREFKDGINCKKDGRNDEAFRHFKRAADLDPHNLDYVTARELLRQLVVSDDIRRGNEALLSKNQIQAMGAFRAALDLDPTNEFARQRLRDSLPDLPPVQHTDDVDPYAAAREIHLEPNSGVHTFKFRGSSRQILEQVAQAYGLTPVIDQSVKSTNVRFEVGDVDWPTAASLMAKMCKVFWIPLSRKQVMFINDDPQNRRDYQRMTLRTFYIPNATTTQELNDVAQSLRVLFDIRYLTMQPGSDSIVVRAPQPIMDAATRFLDGLSTGRPQVLLDIKAFEVSHTAAQQIGTDFPNQFTAFNVPTEAQKLLGNQSVQDIISQLISSGQINQASSSAIAALIAQGLSGQSSIFSQPFLLFGGGITLSALTLPGTTFHLNLNSSQIQTLEHVTLHAAHGDAANFRIGTRYPIINASYAPIYSSAAINKVLQNQTYIAPIPSFNYEDLGILLKATPEVRPHDVALKFDMEIRSLGTTSVNGIPIINNRQYTGSISANDGESIVIAGLLTRSEQKNLTGLPLLSRIPGIGKLFSTEGTSTENTELLLVVTPHILRSRDRSPSEIVLPTTAPR